MIVKITYKYVRTDKQVTQRLLFFFSFPLLIAKQTLVVSRKLKSKCEIPRPTAFFCLGYYIINGC